MYARIKFKCNIIHNLNGFNLKQLNVSEYIDEDNVKRTFEYK